MRAKNEETGAVMVEAVVIFPIVLMAVMAMLFYGLFRLQEAAMLYQVQRVASEGSLMTASPGYAELAGNGTKLGAVSIDWDSFPSGEDVAAYYEAYHTSFGVLYREIMGCTWLDGREIETFGNRVLNTVSVLTAGKLFQPKVEIERDFWGSGVVVQARFAVRTPGALRFFGLPDQISFQQGAYRRAVNPAGFMRNVDLAGDALVVVSEKLGLDEQLGKITECLGKVRDTLF